MVQTVKLLILFGKKIPENMAITILFKFVLVLITTDVLFGCVFYTTHHLVAPSLFVTDKHEVSDYVHGCELMCYWTSQCQAANVIALSKTRFQCQFVSLVVRSNGRQLLENHPSAKYISKLSGRLN